MKDESIEYLIALFRIEENCRDRQLFASVVAYHPRMTTGKIYSLYLEEEEHYERSKDVLAYALVKRKDVKLEHLVMLLIISEDRLFSAPEMTLKLQDEICRKTKKKVFSATPEELIDFLDLAMEISNKKVRQRLFWFLYDTDWVSKLDRLYPKRLHPLAKRTGSMIAKEYLENLARKKSL